MSKEETLKIILTNFFWVAIEIDFQSRQPEMNTSK
jgi:hypothetical protein